MNEHPLVSALADMTNMTRTENGASAYGTTGNPIVDANFEVTKMRAMDTGEIYDRLRSMNSQYPGLTLAWLFYLRDCRGGLGERDSFVRALSEWLCMMWGSYSERTMVRILNLIPIYGRWDDLINIALMDLPERIVSISAGIIIRQLESDMYFAGADDDSNISLLAKWMPSANAGIESRKKALRLIKSVLITGNGKPFFRDEESYRKTLSILRKRIKIVETNVTEENFSPIVYSHVPAGAMLKYTKVFLTKDKERYIEYMKDVAVGKAELKATGLNPYQLYHQYKNSISAANPDVLDAIKDVYDAQWTNLLNSKDDVFEEVNLDNTIAVCDGSYSMTDKIPGTNIQCIEVARSLAIFLSQKLEGGLKDTFIEFSARPRLIDLRDYPTFPDKVRHIERYTDCSNTNIAAVFDVLLQAYLSGAVQKDDMPKQIIVLSDMQFDSAFNDCRYGRVRVGNLIAGPDDATYYADILDALFDKIALEWSKAGFTKLPKLVFWNLMAREHETTIPLKRNEGGLALISGFGVEAMKATTESNPAESLLKVLTSDRYEGVRSALCEENINFDDEGVKFKASMK